MSDSTTDKARALLEGMMCRYVDPFKHDESRGPGFIPVEIRPKEMSPEALAPLVELIEERDKADSIIKSAEDSINSLKAERDELIAEVERLKNQLKGMERCVTFNTALDLIAENRNLAAEVARLRGGPTDA